MIFYDVNHRLQRINKMVVVNFTKWICEDLYAEYLSMLHVLGRVNKDFHYLLCEKQVRCYILS